MAPVERYFFFATKNKEERQEAQIVSCAVVKPIFQPLSSILSVLIRDNFELMGVGEPPSKVVSNPDIYLVLIILRCRSLSGVGSFSVPPSPPPYD